MGGQNWGATLIIAGCAIGANVPVRWAAVGAGCCAAAGVGVSLSQGTSFSNVLNVLIGPPLPALVTYMAVRRGELFDKLRGFPHPGPGSGQTLTRARIAR